MIERNPILNLLAYVVLVFGVVMAVGPIYMMLISATVPNSQLISNGLTLLPGDQLAANVEAAAQRIDIPRLLTNSFVVAFMVMAGKMIFASITAYAAVYFRSPFRHLIFWAVFATLLVPLEVRIIPTYAVAADILSPFTSILNGLLGLHVEVKLNLLNTYPGLSLPLIASATGTFLFRQFFQTIPEELSEAARMDGAGAIRFFLDILLPLSKTNFAALGTLVFVGAWKDYMWPLLVTTHQEMRTIVLGVARFAAADPSQLTQWNLLMASAVIAIIPPLVVVALMQRWFVRGLVGGEK